MNIELDSPNVPGQIKSLLANGYLSFRLFGRSTGSGAILMSSISSRNDKLYVKHRHETPVLVPMDQLETVYAEWLKIAGKRYLRMENGEPVYAYDSVENMKRTKRGLLPYVIQAVEPVTA